MRNRLISTSAIAALALALTTVALPAQAGDRDGRRDDRRTSDRYRSTKTARYKNDDRVVRTRKVVQAPRIIFRSEPRVTRVEGVDEGYRSLTVATAIKDAIQKALAEGRGVRQSPKAVTARLLMPSCARRVVSVAAISAYGAPEETPRNKAAIGAVSTYGRTDAGMSSRQRLIARLSGRSPS